MRRTSTQRAAHRGARAGLLLRFAPALVIWAGGCLPGQAAAIPFPPDDVFVPLTCGGAPATDPVRDAPGGTDPRDIVGDVEHPAVLRYVDASWLYLRMRLDESPARSEDELKPFGWGFLFDADGDPSTYEYLSMANGITEAVDWQANTVHEVPGDATDPAEVELRSYVPADLFRHVGEADSRFGGSPDYFLTWVVAVADLKAAGVPLTDPVVLWAGTSNSTQALDVDFVCDDGSAGPRLPDIGLDPVPLDPEGVTDAGPADTDGDGVDDDEEVQRGTDPFVPELRLVGSGCSAAAGSGVPAGALALLLLAGLGPERRRRRRG